MIRAWYPPSVRSAADRLRYYATHFDTVEVDSSFYALPSARNAQLWAERTPPGFVFHVKAFAMMTRHGVRPEQLPPSLRGRIDITVDHGGRVLHPHPEVRREVFAIFSQALEPLRKEGKLGVILLQFPPYFTAKEENRRYLAWAVEMLVPNRCAVEFRHESWVSPQEKEATLKLLTSLGATYVCVDEPQVPGPGVLPPLTAVTAPIAYVRFHGRNAATWYARSGSAAERFRYLYTPEELEGWIEPIRQLQRQADTTFVMFNNCYADYAPRNAQQLLDLLQSAAE